MGNKTTFLHSFFLLQRNQVFLLTLRLWIMASPILRTLICTALEARPKWKGEGMRGESGALNGSCG